jgi:heptosyltransferase-2
MLDIIGINGDYTSPVLHLEPEELSWARNFKSEHAIVNDRPIIGIHPGGSARWPKKRWGLTQYVKLITQLKGLGFSIMLFAGPQEISFHEELLRRCGKKVIDAGCNLSMRQFASLVNLVDLMICSDSLALHVATALKKKVVALFGPTSVSEIDLFGRGRKIVSRLACVGCYLNRCEKSPSCMDLITWQSVKKAAQELIFDVKKK